jgi:UDP-N-acetylglucosamine--N-acetylmuramyl-(pentapeptide) pyrophosphoryl-undecaprenol N-acetylglucosamine transferase
MDGIKNGESGPRLHVAVSCGGTGGHTFPGLAVAEELKKRGHRVTLWMAGKDVEIQAVQEWDGPVEIVPSEGFQSGWSPRSLLTLWRLFCAVLHGVPRMRKDRPDVILGMGSYASVGPLAAAVLLRVPRVLHEANVLPGRANRLFARGARAVGIAFEATRHWLKHGRLIYTGMPLRPALIAAVEPDADPEFEQELHVLVTGGSGGARALNERVPAALTAAHRAGYRLQVVHLTGRSDPEPVKKQYDAAGIPNQTQAFSHAMADLYRQSHLVIARAGASTCAELTLFRRPALLVPFPHAAGNHQMFNARVLEQAGAADLIPEEELTEQWLQDYLRGLFDHPHRLERMRRAAERLAAPDAVSRLADLVESAA